MAGRVRKASEVAQVREVLEAVFRRELHEEQLYSSNDSTSPCAAEFLSALSNGSSGFEHLVATRELRRLAVLVGNALKYS